MKMERDKFGRFVKGYMPWNKDKTGIYSEETLCQMSKSSKGQTAWNKGKIASEEVRKRLTKTQFKKGNTPWNKGVPRSEETKRKIREKAIGRTFPKDKYPNFGMRGKTCSEEHKRNISNGNTGKKKPPFTEEHKQNLSKAKTGIPSPFRGKPYEARCGVEKAKEAIRKMKEKNIGRKLAPFTEEHKGNISKALKGIIRSEETKNKLKKARAKQITPKTDTKIEVKIQEYLRKLGITFFTHQYMNIEHAYQCDILIPSINLVIECDGDYWHKYPVGRDIDHIRTKELIEKGFKVLRLWENEIEVMSLHKFWEDIKIIQKEIIIKNSLARNENTMPNILNK